MLALFAVTHTAPVAAQRRIVLPDDLLKLEELREVAVAPDGHSVAFVRRRSSPSMRTPQYFQHGADDVWVAPLDGRGPTNLTHGEADGRSYWMPVWSPDSKKLAMVSRKGDADICLLYLWEEETGRLTSLSDRNIAVTDVPYPVLVKPFVWIDNARLVVVLSPTGEQSNDPGRVAMREWPKMWLGEETTASVLDSGVPVNLASRPQQELAIMDLAGKNHLLASATLFVDLETALGGLHLAYLKQTALLQPNPAELLPAVSRYGLLGGLSRFQVAIANTDGPLVVDTKSARFVVPHSFRWSRDGSSFAFIGVREGEQYGRFSVFRGRVGTSLEIVDLPGDVDPHTLVWLEGNRLLVSGEHEVTEDGKIHKRVDWWLLSPSFAPRNVTQNLPTVSGDLLPLSDGRSFFGVAKGDLWRFESASGASVNLTDSFEPKIAAIVWPAVGENVLRPKAGNSVVVSVQKGILTDFYRVDVRSGAMTRLARPSDHAILATYVPETNLALFIANESTGTCLPAVQGEAQRQVLELNTFLRNLQEAECRMIEYRGLDGQDLKGWIVLPATYEAGKRYPLVTWVYAGSIANEVPPSMARFNDGFPAAMNAAALNLQLLAARGYAVLIPSMPLKVPTINNGEAEDPYMEFTKGVLPAVDKVIVLGIADPKRLSVMGQSYGGYTTYGLVTQTNRFKAAIALAGPSDLVSLYGTFVAPFRYGQYPKDLLWMESLSETSVMRMGGPPWKDMMRYLRNSPIFYADRVQTPLLMVYGDMDHVGMQQGEEFFTALYRQGKRARFVRYWGDYHVIGSPANVRDFWRQAYAWLDEFCDISRDDKGNVVFDGDHVKSRNGAAPLKREDFARFDQMILKESQSKSENVPNSQ